jgi:hypothetical protein
LDNVEGLNAGVVDVATFGGGSNLKHIADLYPSKKAKEMHDEILAILNG